MTGFNRLGKVILFVVLATFVFGCTTLQTFPVTDRELVQNQLDVGDNVSVRGKDGSELTFAIDSITDDGIGGDGSFVAWSDAQQIEVRQFSAGKTIGLAAAIAAAVVVVAGAGDSDGGVY